jgi:SAM-dependent methyltransferase
MSKDALTSPQMQVRYPRTAKYEVDWIIENQMGSHCLWLMESLCANMDLQPRLRVLDLGCGKATSSIFLAKEFGVQVWAADWWIPPTENWERILAADLGNQVFPVKAEAHALPFAENFFDVVVGINCLQFFGTDDYYLPNHLVKLVKPGGQIGMVVPGILKEFEGRLPEHLQPYWEPEFYSWHSPDWWRLHWLHTGIVEVECSDSFEDCEGYGIFRRFEEALNGPQMISIDQGRNITFVRTIVRRTHITGSKGGVKSVV